MLQELRLHGKIVRHFLQGAPVNIRTYRNIAPVLGARVYVDPAAIVIGRVRIGDDSSIWPAAVVRGDVHSIEIGARTSIQDGSVLHVTHDGPYSPGGRSLNIGSDVTVGHRVTLHACSVGNKCLVGMGSVVLDGVMIEDFVMLGAGSVVPPGKRLETRGLYVGSPARKVRELTQSEIEFFTYSAAQYVQLKDEYLSSPPR
jgi:carbonic anhydrase/acetyltransferase-like protein (isoleucine patch superfamily)